MSTAMERYQGVILIRLQNAGSKSEGHYAFLVRDDDMSVVKLCREGAVPADDPYFVPFDRQEVVVTGTMSHGGWSPRRTSRPLPGMRLIVKPKKTTNKHENMSQVRLR